MHSLIVSAIILGVFCNSAQGYVKYSPTKTVECRNTLIRTFDGTCNNLENPTFGVGAMAIPRLLPPQYADKKESPKTFGVMRKLPSTRKVSNLVQQATKVSSSGVSHMHVLFGQLITHDFVHTLQIKNEDGSTLDCNCANPNKDCFNIPIPRDDVQFVLGGKTCLKMSRSLPATEDSRSRFFQREQFNSMSSIIDGTFMYGKTDVEALQLRDPSTFGELKMVNNPASTLLKNLPDQDDLLNTEFTKSMQCMVKVRKPANDPCVVAGDLRVSENPGLQSIQHIIARYHNQIARGLKRINQFWNSDKVYSTTRSIISAILQSIIYREYLPPLLGPRWMERFGLTLVDIGYWNGYDSRYNPQVTNAFATAAFRYGHSQVNELMSRPRSNFQKRRMSSVNTAGSYFSNVELQESNGGGCGAFMRGFMIDNARKTDSTVTPALRDQLFTERGERFGNDLLAVNMQRGRDHGLPGYNDYRELCGLSKASTFNDLVTEIPRSVVLKLQEAYDSVDDIDLYVAGLSENHVQGGEVGPTFACILAYAFRAIKKGDRFWHEYEKSPERFTANQLQTIRRTTLARILCDAGEDMKYTFRFPLELPLGQRRNLVDCDRIPKLDLSYWEEKPKPFYNRGQMKELIWSSWLPTNYRHVSYGTAQTIKSHLLSFRPNEICQNHFGFETRVVPGNYYVQIRFSCPPGTIRATDFPFQLSQKYYWGPWIRTKLNYDGSQTLEPSDFGCKKHVDMQVKVRNWHIFALETGDVFERFGHKVGFTCRNRQQIDGRCENYEIRALCEGQSSEHFSNPMKFYYAREVPIKPNRYNPLFYRY